MVDILSVATAVIGLIVLPLAFAAFRFAVKWKGIEDRLDVVVRDIGQIVTNFDRRLRWLEKNIWRGKSGNST